MDRVEERVNCSQHCCCLEIKPLSWMKNYFLNVLPVFQHSESAWLMIVLGMWQWCWKWKLAAGYLHWSIDQWSKVLCSMWRDFFYFPKTEISSIPFSDEVHRFFFLFFLLSLFCFVCLFILFHRETQYLLMGKKTTTKGRSEKVFSHPGDYQLVLTSVWFGRFEKDPQLLRAKVLWQPLLGRITSCQRNNTGTVYPALKEQSE